MTPGYYSGRAGQIPSWDGIVVGLNHDDAIAAHHIWRMLLQHAEDWCFLYSLSENTNYELRQYTVLLSSSAVAFGAVT